MTSTVRARCAKCRAELEVPASSGNGVTVWAHVKPGHVCAELVHSKQTHESSRMRVKRWPNGLGFDVGRHEALIKKDGRLQIIVYRLGGAWRRALFLPGSDLVAAVHWTLRHGKRVEA